MWSVDIATSTKSELVSLGELAPDGMDVTPDGRLIVTEDEHGPKAGGYGRVRKLDVSTGVLGSNTLLAGSGRYVYWMTSCLSPKASETLPIFWPSGVAVSPDGRTAFVMAYGTRSVLAGLSVPELPQTWPASPAVWLR